MNDCAQEQTQQEEQEQEEQEPSHEQKVVDGELLTNPIDLNPKEPTSQTSQIPHTQEQEVEHSTGELKEESERLAALSLKWVAKLKQDAVKEILMLFSRSFATVLYDQAAFAATVRQIKDCFIARDYLGIFTDSTKLFVYIARWAPPRALCYLDLITNDPVLKFVLDRNIRCTCLGAGPGSELIALAAYAATQTPTMALPNKTKHDSQGSGPTPKPRFIDIQLHDIGDFKEGIDVLTSATRERWGLCEDRMRVGFTKGNMLATPMQPQLVKLISSSHLVTLLFTVNELFQQNPQTALNTLKEIVSMMRKSAFLLVADSFSDMSTLKLNGNEYRITMVLDNLKDLKKCRSDDSCWYRVPKNHGYRCELQNVHYFVRCYQKK